jgi:hypothetical protein
LIDEQREAAIFFNPRYADYFMQSVTTGVPPAIVPKDYPCFNCCPE